MQIVRAWNARARRLVPRREDVNIWPQKGLREPEGVRKLKTPTRGRKLAENSRNFRRWCPFGQQVQETGSDLLHNATFSYLQAWRVHDGGCATWPLNVATTVHFLVLTGQFSPSRPREDRQISPSGRPGPFGRKRWPFGHHKSGMQARWHPIRVGYGTLVAAPES
eukprot:gene7734-biopygen36